MLESQLLGRVRAVFRKKRRRFRPGQELQPAGDDLDLPRRDLAVDLRGRARGDLALDLDDVFGARLPRSSHRRLARARLLEQNLDDAAPVAQRQEDQVAEVAAAPDPAAKEDAPSGIRRREIFGRLPDEAHASLAAPSRSASSDRGKVSCSPVASLLTVTAPSARSRSPTSTASIPFLSRPLASASSKRALARASPFLIPRAERSTSTHPPGRAVRISRATRTASARSSVRWGSTRTQARGDRRNGATCSSRSSPIAKPMAGTEGPPRDSTRPSYRPPPRIASCAPRSSETISNTVRV